MQIFVTSKSPEACARVLDDKRVVKMVLESAQLLSTAMHLHGDTRAPYKPTHVNHPCSIWVRENINNYGWLLQHFLYLNYEYTQRFGRTHKCADYIDVFRSFADKNDCTYDEPKYFVNCSLFKEVDNVFTAYQLTLNEKWGNDKARPKWNGREY